MSCNSKDNNIKSTHYPEILQHTIDDFVSIMTRLQQQCIEYPDLVYDNKHWIKQYLSDSYTYDDNVIDTIVTLFELLAEDA